MRVTLSFKLLRETVIGSAQLPDGNLRYIYVHLSRVGVGIAIGIEFDPDTDSDPDADWVASR